MLSPCQAMSLLFPFFHFLQDSFHPFVVPLFVLFPIAVSVSEQCTYFCTFIPWHVLPHCPATYQWLLLSPAMLPIITPSLILFNCLYLPTALPDSAAVLPSFLSQSPLGKDGIVTAGLKAWVGVGSCPSVPSAFWQIRGGRRELGCILVQSLTSSAHRVGAAALLTAVPVTGKREARYGRLFGRYSQYHMWKPQKHEDWKWLLLF